MGTLTWCFRIGNQGPGREESAGRRVLPQSYSGEWVDLGAGSAGKRLPGSGRAHHGLVVSGVRADVHGGGVRVHDRGMIVRQFGGVRERSSRG